MIYFISVIVGLAFGSFANVCILRLPKNQSMWSPRSFCPHCERPVKNIHNVPLFSFLILKGRFFHCRGPISWQYPLIEILMAALFLFHAWFFEDSIPRLVVWGFLGFYL